jgi:cobalt-precorrin 5A hydrolase
VDVGEGLMIVAGIGCRRGVSAEEVEAALTAAIEAARQQLLRDASTSKNPPLPSGLSRPDGVALPWNVASPDELTLSRIATAAAKGQEPGINAAAAARGVPLVLIAQRDLEANNLKTLTRSSNSMRAMNVHSVAEAAALAGAGAGSRLLGPRIAAGPVTCALAVAPAVIDATDQSGVAAGQPQVATGQPGAAAHDASPPATLPGADYRVSGETVARGHCMASGPDIRRGAKGTNSP